MTADSREFRNTDDLVRKVRKPEYVLLNLSHGMVSLI